MSLTLFFTGFPGFITSRLVVDLAQKKPEATFIFLVQETFKGRARERIAQITTQSPGFDKRSQILVGDIFLENLGLNAHIFDDVRKKITHIFHLAAIYDLAVPAALAYRVNVLGTANLLDFAEKCPGLERLDYISTCYVSGDRKGIIYEDELDCGQHFKNHYESTKCWAEMEVRRRLNRLPIAISRPAIVVGDSKTGATDKYDGPYFIVNLLNRLPTWLPWPHIGDGESRVNLVPVDFLVSALVEIWDQKETIGKTFQLADKHPRTAKEIVSTALAEMGFAQPKITVPPKLVETLLGIPHIQKFVKVPEQTLIYFNHDAHYDTTHLDEALKRSQLKCPDFLTVLPNLVTFVKNNPNHPG